MKLPFLGFFMGVASAEATTNPSRTLSDKEIADILKFGTPVMEAAPTDNMRPDGHDRQVLDVHGTRYVVFTGGLSGHHRYGTRLPNHQ